MLRALLERGDHPRRRHRDLGRGAERRGRSRPIPTLEGVEHLESRLAVGCGARTCSRAARSAPGLEPPHAATTTSSRTRACGTLIERGRAAPSTFEELAVPLRVVATDLDHRRRGRVRARTAAARAARPARRCPGIFPPVRHDGRTLVDGAVVDTVPISHALAGPVDRIFVLDVSDPLMRPAAPLAARRRGPRLRHQPQPALRARAAQCAARTSRSIVLPAPDRRPRLLRLLRRRELIDEAHDLAELAPRRGRRRQAPPPRLPPSVVAPRRRGRLTGQRNQVTTCTRTVASRREVEEHRGHHAEHQRHPGGDGEHDPGPTSTRRGLDRSRTSPSAAGASDRQRDAQVEERGDDRRERTDHEQDRSRPRRPPPEHRRASRRTRR